MGATYARFYLFKLFNTIVVELFVLKIHNIQSRLPKLTVYIFIILCVLRF